MSRHDAAATSRLRIPECAGKVSTKLAAQSGFSLIEMMVAFAIMALSLGVLYQILSGSVSSLRDTARVSEEVLIAQSVLQRRSAVPSEGWIEDGEESGGYRWSVRSKPYQDTQDSSAGYPLHRVEIQVWRAGERNGVALRLATLLPVRAQSSR